LWRPVAVCHFCYFCLQLERTGTSAFGGKLRPYLLVASVLLICVCFLQILARQTMQLQAQQD